MTSIIIVAGMKFSKPLNKFNGKGMDITLDFKSKRVQGTVTLPASKSISNRVLIVNALADSELPIENLADCDDTQSMVRILCSENSYFDVGHAGTAMRFLTAYLSRIIGKWVLTGSELPIGSKLLPTPEWVFVSSARIPSVPTSR